MQKLPKNPGELSGKWCEIYEYRAAIREYDGEQTREYAEAMAFREVIEQMRGLKH